MSACNLCGHDEYGQHTDGTCDVDTCPCGHDIDWTRKRIEDVVFADDVLATLRWAERRGIRVS